MYGDILKLGTMEFSASSTFKIGGTFDLRKNSTFVGQGNAILDGNITVTSIFDVSGSTRVTSGTVTFTEKADLQNFGNPLRVSGGLVSLVD